MAKIISFKVYKKKKLFPVAKNNFNRAKKELREILKASYYSQRRTVKIKPVRLTFLGKIKNIYFIGRK